MEVQREELGDYSRNLEASIKDNRERLSRTEERIRGLISFIADGDRSTYVVSALRDMEAHAEAERADLDRLTQESREPLRLPSIDELTNLAFDQEDRLMEDSVAGRVQLQRWLKDEQIRISPADKGS